MAVFEEQVNVEMERVWSSMVVSMLYVEKPEVRLRHFQSC